MGVVTQLADSTAGAFLPLENGTEASVVTPLEEASLYRGQSDAQLLLVHEALTTINPKLSNNYSKP